MAAIPAVAAMPATGRGGISDGVGFGINLAIALAAFALGAGVFLARPFQSAILHTILDTSVFLTGGLIALLLWDIARRTAQTLPLLLALAFGVLAMGELLHTFAALEQFSGTQPLGLSAVQWRAGTWGPPAHTLVIGVSAALLLRDQPGRVGGLFVMALAVLFIALFAVFQELPRYVAPGLLGITRPTLVAMPLLWAITGYCYWRISGRSEIAHAVAVTAILLVLAHGFMLYSRAPSDAIAMVAHYGKVIGDLLMLLSLTQIGAADTVRRLRAERALQHLNEELEQRVRVRTLELEDANTSLRDQIALRVQADRRLQTQLERAQLLNDITRALNERQNLSSLFKIVVRALETQLPVEFAGVCLYDATGNAFTVSEIGAKSRSIAAATTMAEGARIEVDKNGLSRCIGGELVYEPDISSVHFPFPTRLAGGGLRALVIAPLKFEDSVFGMLLVARASPDSFSSSDCEFLLSLSTHVGLAAHQAQLYANIQRAYDDLRQSQQVVLQQERLRALGQMASGIAHDINNAISPLALTTQSLIETEPGMSGRVRSFMETVKRVVNDIAATVARMREFYRQRDDEGAPRAVDLNELAQQTIELTRARWSDMPQQRGIVVHMRTVFDPNLPKAAGLESEIRESLTNLIFNAVDAMPDGGTAFVGTGTRPRGSKPGEQELHTVFVEVTDTGIGMDEETRRRCLEPFFTTKGERGTGLGLAMVYGAMKRLSGNIEIESAIGKGTTIRLLLPEAPATAMQAEEAAPIDPLPPLKLLLIDDDPYILDSMRMVLELEGHRVSTADGGAEGLALLKAASKAGDAFQVVFTDLGMPNMDGRAVANAIKVIAPDTPVILLTGWGERLGAQTLSTGVNYVLSKPPELNDVRKALLYCTSTQAVGV